MFHFYKKIVYQIESVIILLLNLLLTYAKELRLEIIITKEGQVVNNRSLNTIS